MKHFIDMDGVLVDLQRDLTKAQICAQVPSMTIEDWANLPKTEAFDWWCRMIIWGPGAYILTACASSIVYEGKLRWISHHIPSMVNRVIFVPHGTKHRLASRPTDMLYDDYSKNINDWITAGGTGVLCDTTTGFPVTMRRHEDD